MKRVFFFVCLCLITAPCAASEFKDVTPVIINNMIVEWDYEFFYTWKKGQSERIAHVSKQNCKRPLIGNTKRPLLPVPSVCFNTESAARVSAKKDMDKLEKDVLSGVYGVIK